MILFNTPSSRSVGQFVPSGALSLPCYVVKTCRGFFRHCGIERYVPKFEVARLSPPKLPLEFACCLDSCFFSIKQDSTGARHAVISY